MRDLVTESAKLGSESRDDLGPVLLDAVDVTTTFGGIKANDNVTLEVREHERVGLIGPNGSGKTTFLNTVAGYYQPSVGRIAFQGARIDRMQPHEVCRMGIARTFQNLRLFYGMTTLQNVATAATLRAKSLRLANERAVRLLHDVGLAHKADAMASTLSTGQRKRLEVARALATDPSLILLDEPLAGVDPGNRAPIVELLERVSSNGMTILIVEHDPDVVRRLCTRVIAFQAGRKIADGAPDDVYSREDVRSAYLEGA